MKNIYPLLIALFLIPHFGIGSAGTIYQYTDENGIKRFSDTPPQTDQPVEASHAFTAPEQEEAIAVTRSRQDGRIVLSIANQLHAPVEVEMSFKKLTNLISTPSLPKRFVVPARSKINAVALRVIDPGRPSPFHYNYRYTIGSPDARHTPQSPYLFPYKKGQSYKVTQAFNGTTSHDSASSRFAVDFSMPVGTPVLCTRNGTVVLVEQDYVWGGLDKAYYKKRINYIRVLHRDGTMAFYGHLKRGSARVRPGDRINAGQVIAESGHTGYSSGPHLHFMIQKNQDLRWESVPFEFKGINGEGITPVKGRRYQAT